MALHDQIHQLATAMGRRVLSDSDELRAALDDYLPEDAATAGEINLLVDAVRLGAFEQLQRMLAEGASATAAVRRAGEMLAYNRGSTDRDGASWACAVLGYAAGLLPETEVMRYSTTMPQPRQPPGPASPPAQPQPPRMAGGPPTAPLPSWTAGSPGAAAHPPAAASMPGSGVGPPAARTSIGTPPSTAGIPPQQPTSRSRGWLVAAGALLVFALGAGGVLWAMVDDEPTAPGAVSAGTTEPSTSSVPSTPAPSSTVPSSTVPSSSVPSTTQPSTTAPRTSGTSGQVDPVRAGVTATLRGYFDAINDGDYDRAMSWVGEEIRAESSRDQWYDDFATTSDDRLDVNRVREAGDVVLVGATFRSQQDPGYGPEGAEDATCLLWSVNYEMTLVGDKYVISDASGQGDPPWTRCD